MHRLRYRFRRTTLIIVASFALLAGLGVARTKIPTDPWLVWASGILAVTLWRSRSIVTLCLILVFGLSLGWWRGSCYMAKLHDYQQLTKQKVTLVGIAADDATYNDKQQLAFPLQRIMVVSPRPTALAGSIKVSGFGEAAIYKGDRVQISGKLYPTRGNHQATIAYADLQVIASDSSPINEARRQFAAGIQTALPEPLASFGLGLLVGQRSTLPDDVSEHLLAVGLTHIIAVSGYNLTILVEACRRILGKRSKRHTATASLLLICTFLLLAGNSPAISRAAFVSILGLTAWYYGRRIKPVVLIAFAAAITALWNPFYLWSSIGWYLSFLAFFGVLVLAPLVLARLFKNREPSFIICIMAETICADIMTIPIVLYVFGQMSFVALPANVLVAVFVPLAMLLCTIAGLAGMFVPLVVGWFAWPAKWLLTYMLDTAQLLSRIPYAFIEGWSLPLLHMLFIYGMIVLCSVLLWRKTTIGKPVIITDTTLTERTNERTLKMVNN